LLFGAVSWLGVFCKKLARARPLQSRHHRLRARAFPAGDLQHRLEAWQQRVSLQPEPSHHEQHPLLLLLLLSLIAVAENTSPHLDLVRCFHSTGDTREHAVPQSLLHPCASQSLSTHCSNQVLFIRIANSYDSVLVFFCTCRIDAASISQTKLGERP
jgi:hypothetical protein